MTAKYPSNILVLQVAIYGLTSSFWICSAVFECLQLAVEMNFCSALYYVINKQTKNLPGSSSEQMNITDVAVAMKLL